MEWSESVRQSLGREAEWRELQMGLHNLIAYLQFTRLEDVRFEGVVDGLRQLEARRAAVLARLGPAPVEG